MTVTAAAADESLALGLRPERGKHVDHDGPDGEAAEQDGQELEVGLARTNPERHWIHDRTFLSLVIAVQLCWLTALIFGLSYLSSIF